MNGAARNKETTHGLGRPQLSLGDDQVSVGVARAFGPDALRTASRLLLIQETLTRTSKAIRTRVGSFVF